MWYTHVRIVNDFGCRRVPAPWRDICSYRNKTACIVFPWDFPIVNIAQVLNRTAYFHNLSRAHLRDNCNSAAPDYYVRFSGQWGFLPCGFRFHVHFFLIHIDSYQGHVCGCEEVYYKNWIVSNTANNSRHTPSQQQSFLVWATRCWSMYSPWLI